jgi:hypothetical protein
MQGKRRLVAFALILMTTNVTDITRVDIIYKGGQTILGTGKPRVFTRVKHWYDTKHNTTRS